MKIVEFKNVQNEDRKRKVEHICEDLKTAHSFIYIKFTRQGEAIFTADNLSSLQSIGILDVVKNYLLHNSLPDYNDPEDGDMINVEET